MKAGDATKAWNVLQAVAEELDRDAPLMQALALLRIAMEGDGGLDQARLLNELRASSAAVSRTAQALSRVHYMKDREGYGFVEILFDARDRRSRVLKLTAAGRKAVEHITSAMSGVK